MLAGKGGKGFDFKRKTVDSLTPHATVQGVYTVQLLPKVGGQQIS